MPLDLICLDADDTLWRHESYFQDAARRYQALLAPFANGADTAARLVEAEDRNLHIYGYGVKGFTLSMLETALQIGGDELPAATVKGILDIVEAPLVSSDFNHNPASSSFAVDQTKVIDGTFVRVMAWYDNEWGFSNRMADVAVAMGALL